MSKSSIPELDQGYLHLVVVCYPRKLITHEAAKQCAKNPQSDELIETKAAHQVMGTLRNFWEIHAHKTEVNAVGLALK
jgi:hypothetical protein